jgi:hypothetical protein
MESSKYIAFVLGIILISLILWIVCTNVSEHYSRQDPILKKLTLLLDPLLADKNKVFQGALVNLNYGKPHFNILSKVGLFRGKKSFTINKRKVYLCLYNKQTEYYDTHTLMYVLLHELSHVYCHNIGHTPEFHAIFSELLVEANKMGIYDPDTPVSPNYCDHGGKDDGD